MLAVMSVTVILNDFFVIFEHSMYEYVRGS